MEAQDTVDGESGLIAALVAQKKKRSAARGSNLGHQRKASPAYAVHVDQCRKQNKILHNVALLGSDHRDALLEYDEPPTSTSPVQAKPSSLFPNDKDILDVDDTLHNFRLISPDGTMKTDKVRARTLSASSKASVDSLRSLASQGSLVKSGLGPPSTLASPSVSPVCTAEVYELSRYFEQCGDDERTTMKNPNKVLLTVDMRTSVVVVANSIASNVFGYTQSEFEGMPFERLLHSDNYLAKMSLREEYCGPDGAQLTVSEQLLIAATKSGSSFPVSLWMMPLKSNKVNHCLAIMEPVERTTGILTLDVQGNVIDADPQLASVFGYHDRPDDFLLSSVSDLMPKLVLPAEKAISLPDTFRRQHVTGQVRGGGALPLTVLMRFSTETDPVMFQGAGFPEKHGALDAGSDIQCVVILYHNVTGLMTVKLDGTVSSCDSTFCTMLFGYSSSELCSKAVDQLIPGVWTEVRSAGLKCVKFNTQPYHHRLALDSPDSVTSNGSAASSSSCTAGAGLASTTPGKHSASKDLGVILERADANSIGSFTDAAAADRQGNPCSNSMHESMNDAGVQWTRSPTPESGSEGNRKQWKLTRSYGTPFAKPVSSLPGSGDFMSHLATSLESNRSSDPSSRSASLTGLSLNTTAIHKDDFRVDINIKVKLILFNNETSLLCFWLKREHGAQQSPSPTSSFTVIERQDDLNKLLAEAAFKGPYAEAYTNIRTIGSGAFGDVKLAYQNSTGDEVIVKCIGKKDVLSCGWTHITLEQRDQFNIITQQSFFDATDSVPTELFLLRTLEHPNIVSLIDVFETEHFYQLVMAKHGEGMDLFEFIDHEPAVNEPLAFFIFSQVVDAVDYLHQRNIIHRDIKDENIIIDRNFRVKLIDFGSAAIMKEGQLFDLFCGTVEYCSPEVLSGNKYRGPELEMWTLGVTLYTLVFFENPFKDADDIIGGHLDPPFVVSPRLTRVLLWLLHPDPKSRCTIPQLRECSWMKQTVDSGLYHFEDVLNNRGFLLLEAKQGLIFLVRALGEKLSEYSSDLE